MPAEVTPFAPPLPDAAEPALRIVRRLRAGGHEALLAGGCVRDLLLGVEVQDYDVATDADPERVCALFRATRRVGAQFGVVLVRSGPRWVEVATFRSDDAYLDGRRPSRVTFCDARADALRRDFTVNGMFFDPLAGTLIDYVGGREDLARKRIRAIGDPAARLAEDHLRRLRAVRFAARLAFDIEPRTLESVRCGAAALRGVAAERVREELEKMLAHPARARAVTLLADAGLLEHLWDGARFERPQLAAAVAVIERLPPESAFETALAALLSDRDAAEVERIGRALSCSNEQREAVAWLVEHVADLDRPDAVALAHLKRLMAHRAFGMLRTLVEARLGGDAGGRAALARLAERLARVAPDAVAPPPLVTGHDLHARGVSPGPVFKRVLDELYRRQLEEELATRSQALSALDTLLREELQRGGSKA